MKDRHEHGVYLWWPEQGETAFHPEDRQAVRHWIPSDRVWRRNGRQGPFVVLQYGQTRIRVLPTLFEPVVGEGFEIDQWVEVRSKLGKNEPRTGVIREMRWDERRRRILYYLREADCELEHPYTADDLKHVDPTPTPAVRQGFRQPGEQSDGGLELE